MNREIQISRISHATCSFLGFFGYSKGIWNHSPISALVAVTLAYGIDQSCSWAIQKFFRPQADTLAREIIKIVEKPSQNQTGSSNNN